MNRLSKILKHVICLTLVLSCSSKNDESYRIAFSQCISKDDWRKAMDYEMKVEASLYSDIDLTIFQADGNVEKQKGQVRNMINGDYDVIIISPIEPEPLAPLVEEAHEKGIPVVIIDRKINSEKYTAFVGADNMEVGRNAGNYIASDATEKVNVVEIKGSGNSFPKIERNLGFHQVVDLQQNINVINSFDVEELEYKLGPLLDNIGEIPIHYIYAFNDNIAFEAWKIAKSKRVEKEIEFIGVDGLHGEDNGIELVRNGILSASILYPTGGDEAVKTAYKIIKGESVAKNNLLNTTVIDYRNADIMKNQFDKIRKHQTDIENQQSNLKALEETFANQNVILKILMGLLIISLLLATYSVYSTYSLKKKKRQLELTNNKITIQRNQIEKIADQIKVTNEAKTNFFTGLSHEFKTPITLILSAIESLKDYNRSSGRKEVYELDIVNNNSKRLLRLINNLLDFRKVEDKKFNLRVSKTNIYRFSKQVVKDFDFESRKRNIELKVSTNNEGLELFIDRNLMDKVYFNLLSNAFKFTPDNGKIEVNINDIENTNDIKIHIKDNGIGIPMNELTKVFDPFFKGSNNRKNSSGIGLHLSRQFINLHLGKMNVKSHHGTEFIISLFKGDTHFNEDQIVYDKEIADTELIELLKEDSSVLETENVSDEQNYLILLIEDNRDLSNFLSRKLKTEFNVRTSDGTDGIDMAFEHIPDLILCDVNLPDKSGFEICEILKDDLRTSHIPVVILTALSNKESYLKGLDVGADLYLTKPFSYSILNQSIRSMLYNRERLRYYYTSNIYLIDQSSSLKNKEYEFIAQLNEYIENNIDDTTFSVEGLSEALYMSRVQLYRKVKSMLGLSVSDYISNFRLERAKIMLEKSDQNIAEIAYKNGFSSPSYFSTVFKSKYGVSPTAFKKAF